MFDPKILATQDREQAVDQVKRPAESFAEKDDACLFSGSRRTERMNDESQPTVAISILFFNRAYDGDADF